MASLILAAALLVQPAAAASPTPPPSARDLRLTELGDSATRRDPMLEAWDVGDNARLGLGRFDVGEIARARTHLERARDMPGERHNRRIAGAGFSLRF